MLIKKVGGLSFTSLEDAMRVLMSKWIIQALLLGQSNLQVILNYCIMQLQPSYMAYVVVPLSSCYFPASLSKVDQKDGAILLNHGR